MIELLRGEMNDLKGQYHRFSRRVYWILLGIGVALAASGIGFYFVIAELSERADEGRRLGEQNRALVAQINSERARNTRDACLQSNRRYLRAQRIIDRRIEQLPVEQRVQAQAGRDFTLDLITAIVAPYQDCDELVRERVRRVPRRP